jgi:hypothetical protein
MRKIRMAAAVAALALAPLAGLAAPAAGSATPDGGGPGTYQEAFGAMLWIGGLDITAGHPAQERPAPGRTLTNHFVSGTYHGDTRQTLTTSAGTFLAAVTTGATPCQIVTFKSTHTTSNGTEWTIVLDGTHFRITNVLCDQSSPYNGNGEAQLAGRGVLNSQLTICGLPFNCAGSLRQWDPH